MLKAIERMHVRSKMIQIGCSCMGRQLAACYRTLRDEETGFTFCMIMYWDGSVGECIDFRVQESDELMHLCFEDYGCDFNRERKLKAEGNLKLEDAIVDSPVYNGAKTESFC